MKAIVLYLILILTCMHTNGQNLIGYSGKEIKNYMKEKRQEMNSEKVINNRFNYLKYSGGDETETVLFFLDKDSVCKNIRITCHPMYKATKVKEFNSIYKSNGENKWIDKQEGKEFLVQLKDEQWSCVIVIEPKK